MMETTQAASPVAVLDVTEVASLRKRLGHAATALKVIGILSAVLGLIYLSSPFEPAVIILLLMPGCAFLIAKRLRSGRAWAVSLAAIWLAVYVAQVVHDALPKIRISEYFDLLGAAIFIAPVYFLARGLFAFATYRAHQQRERSSMIALALNPYEEGLRIKKRPKFISKKSGAAYAFLVLSPLPYLVLWLSGHQGVLVVNDQAELIGTQIAGVAAGCAVVAWGARIYRRARRAAMMPGSALTKKDRRPIVLYLRSFQDDTAIKLYARAANGRILPERLLRIPFEEVVTDHLWGYGPVLAIGDPRKKSEAAPLGAARDYADDSTWQQKVIDLMQDAALIVVVAGGTQGLAWEIDTIARRGALGKLVLVLPPVGVLELQERWKALAGHAESDVLPAQIDFARARAVIFPKGAAALIVGKKGNDWTYEAALDEAALVIANERDAVQATAPSSQLSRAGRMRQVLGPIASDLASMATAALLLGLVFLAFGVVAYRNVSSHPYASPGYQRDKFVNQVVEQCRQGTHQLSAERQTNYCTCFANNSADVITPQDLSEMESDRTQAKLKSVASACSEKTLGR